jgi:DNA-binding beta-propeller fold protein YncE
MSFKIPAWRRELKRLALATIKTVVGPEAIAINVVTNRVYTSNSGENSVSDQRAAGAVVDRAAFG